MLDNDTGELHANADIAVKGPMNGVSVTGRARIVHGTVYIPNGSGPRQVSTDDPAVLGVVDTSDVAMQKIVTTTSPMMQNMKMNVRLSVARDTWARSPDANVEFYTQGPLTVIKSAGDQGISLDGVVNTERGEYQFLGRRFVLSQGTAIFTGTPEINPLLQLGAQYTIQPAGRPALNINIAINGTVRKPVIVLSSDAQPPLSQSDLLSYLAFGQSSTSLVSSAGGGSSGGGSANGGLVGSAAALATRQLTATALGVMTRQFAATRGALARRRCLHDHAGGNPRPGRREIRSADHSRRYAGRGGQVRRPADLCCDADPRFRHDTRLRRAAAALEGVSHRGERRLALHLSISPRSRPNVPIRSEATFGAFLIREWKF